MRIRPAEPRDAAALVEVDLAALADGRGMLRAPGEASPVAEIERRVASLTDPAQAAMFVAELDGRVVGESKVRRYPLSGVRHVVDVSLQVHPEAQGRGLGRALLAAVIEHAAVMGGVERVELRVRGDNHRAIALYRSFEFAFESLRPAWVDRPDGRVDDWQMVRFLVPPVTEKACGLVIREDRGHRELLVLQHPLMGWQLPRGTIDPGERPEDAVVREVSEETGLSLAGPRSLGRWTSLDASGRCQRWHSFVLDAPSGLPDLWDHDPVGSPVERSLRFRLSWARLEPLLVYAFHPFWHEAVLRALA